MAEVTLAQILSDAYRRLNFSSTPPADVTTRLTAFANQTYRELLSMPSLEHLREATTTLDTVADTERTDLPAAVARLKAISDRTNGRVLKQLTYEELLRRDPGLTSSGTPWAYARFGNQAVQWHPIPSDVFTFHVDYTAEITELSAAGDEPIFPSDYHWLLVTGIRMKEYEKADDGRYTVAAKEFKEGVSALRQFTQADGSGLVSLRGRQRRPWSQLGPWYPDGS